jgi:hypothetical protein
MATPTAAQAAHGPHSGPYVSVVAIWGPDYSDLPAWVSRLATAADNSRVEVVVVTTEAEPPATERPLDPEAPIGNLRLTHVSSPPPRRAMRRAGMAAATGDVVLLTESGERDFEFRLAAVLRLFEARWGNLSLAELPVSESGG